MTDKEQYKKICEQHTELPVFLQHWWMDAVCSQWDAAIARRGEHVAGVWPYPLEQKLGINILRNPILTPYLGPHVFFPPDIKAGNRDGYEHETIVALLEQMPFCKVWNLSLQPGFKQAGVLRGEGLRLQVQQTFLIDLRANEEELFANLKETLRRNIRAAEKEITIVDAPEYVADLYHFQKHTLAAKGVAQQCKLTDMQRIMAACRLHDAGTLWLAKSNDVILASIWNVWDSNTSYYFMGAQNPGTDSYKAMSLLLWHAIREAKKRGNSYFDMEGSMDQGVERFFRNFGGQRELYMIAEKNDSWLWKMKVLLKR